MGALSRTSTPATGWRRRATLFRTKTNELSVKAAHLGFLVKALRPLPSKWHGLTDVEQRYRQRYVDLIVNDGVKATFETRAKIVRSIRNYFDTHGYIEVETPMMQPIASGAAARPFRTHHNALDIDLFMRIAPELYLKRLIVGGLSRVYEINRNFRNEGISTQHNPEFTMLEFYEAYADYNDLIALTEELLSGLAAEVCGSETMQFRGNEIRFAKPFARYTMKEAIAHFGSIDRGRHRRSRASSKRCVAEARASTMQTDVAKMNAGKLIAELFEAVSEEHLIQPTFITDFPTEVSPLSKQRRMIPKSSSASSSTSAGWKWRTDSRS